MAFDAVIFDMDGVLCELDDDRRIEFLRTKSAMSAEELAEAIWGSGFEDESDLGHYLANDYLEEFGERIGCPLSPDEWVAYRRSGMTPFPAILEIATKMALSHRIAVLTNNGHMLKHSLREVFPELHPIFGDNLFVSAEFRTRKPDSNIFAAICQRMNVEPGRTLMIDDRIENIEGAEAAGLVGHRFVSEAVLREFLLKSGIDGLAL